MSIRRNVLTVGVAVAAMSLFANGQETAEDRIRRSLEGREMLIKMDLPATEAGVNLIVDNTNVSLDEENYKRLIRENGISIKKGNRPRITGVRFAGGGIELDLDGGGSPGRDWVIGRVALTGPAAVAPSDREVELERRLQDERNISVIAFVRNELDAERARRIDQEERNRVAFSQALKLRTEYINANRKNLGAKLRIIIRTRNESVPLRDVVKALGKYAELLPREPAPK